MRAIKVGRQNFNELTLDDMRRWPRVAKLGVVAVVFLGLTTVGYGVAVRGHVRQHEELVYQQKELEQALSVKQQQAQQSEGERAYVRKLEHELHARMSAWPSKVIMSDWLERLAKTAAVSGVELELLAPQPEITHEFYVEYPVVLVVSGSYSQLTEMLNRFSRMKPSFTLEEFTVKPQGGDEPGLSMQEKPLLMSTTVKLYQHTHPSAEESAVIEEMIDNFTHADVRKPISRDPFKPVSGLSRTDWLGQLKWVGTLKAGSQIWGLIQQPDGFIIRVQRGDRLGEWGLVLIVNEQQVVIEGTTQETLSEKRQLITLDLVQANGRTG